MKVDFTRVTDAANRLWRSRLGRLRTSTVVLIVAFIALSWVQQQYRPATVPGQAPQVVPPGYVPDPAYTWVPRTKLEAPRTTTTTTTTTTPTTTTPTTTPTETPETTVPGESPTPTTVPPTATTTVVDPDGPGLLPPITLPVFPGSGPTQPTDQPQPGPQPVAPALPR